VVGLCCAAGWGLPRYEADCSVSGRHRSAGHSAATSVDVCGRFRRARGGCGGLWAGLV